jgi:iron complex outermembrane recepter protein
MDRLLRSSVSSLAFMAAFSGLGASHAMAQEQAQAPANVTTQTDTETQIVVTGVRQSIESSIDEKRRSSEIKDTITAEDIGQLANENISEALQRITGVQVTRSADGEGQGVQIRGLSENNVQLNGEIISGTAADRGVNFQDLPPELFAGVDILKAQTADAIEGSLGGTINLKTRAPLVGKKRFTANLAITEKRADVGDLSNQDINALFIRQFRDTGIGDIGVLMNFGYRETSTVAEIYGGGDFDDAPGIWIRKTGDQVPQNNANAANANFNFFFQPTVSNQANPYRYDLNEDPNGDGVSDVNDVYYIPGQFGFNERRRDDIKKSFNGTLQWKPSANLDIRFDTVLTDIEENLVGSNYSVSFNVPRAGVLSGGPANTFSLLGDTPLLGEVYLLESGRLASATNRIGAAPSINTVARDSQQYTLEADWQITSNLSLFAKGTSSRGQARTIIQAQLNTGIEQQGGATPAFNGQDFYNFVDFDYTQGKIPDVTFYENPFPAPNFGVTSLVAPGNLVVLNPADINYARQRYFQYQRNASDTKNSDDSFRLDLTWEPEGNFFTAFKAGFRWAERSFERSSFQNPNQNAGVFTAWDGVRAPAQLVNIQRIPVNPAGIADPAAAATSQFLLPCIEPAGREGLLSQFGGNLPRTWSSTGACNLAGVEEYFNLIDIRAVNPATGAGFYERTAERFDVAEQTLAGYLRADFLTALGEVEMFGNVGLRYVETKTSSGGFLPSATTPGAFDTVVLPGKYDDFLPSANVNFALTKDLILRLAYSRTLGRPGLAQISPGLNIIRGDVVDGFDGFGTSGNPGLEPVRSDNFDASAEWYYAKASYFSAAVFQKNIDTTIFLGADQVPLQVGDEVFAVRTFGNFAGTKIKGLELGMAHAFSYLPGPLRHLGISANYTIVDESSDLVDQEGDPIGRRGLSDRTFNIEPYYDDGRFSVRLAYNNRSEFTRRENVALGFARPETLPEIEAARDQLDLAVRYRFTKNFRATFNAVNLTDTGTVRFMKYDALVNYLAFAGRRYNLGVSVSF